MDVTVTNLSEVSREVEIIAKSEELQEHFDKAYKEYQKKIEIRGFRKGKAPMDLVRKMYGDLIEQEALQEIANALYRQAIREKDLKPIGEPVLTDMDYKRGEQFRCNVQYDVRPSIVLHEYKNIPIRKLVHDVTEEEIEKELRRLQRVNSSLESTERASDDEHVVTVDMQELDETGAPLIGRTTNGVRFYLADEQLEQPFKDALKGAAVGMESRVQFEHQHGEHTHAVNSQLVVTRVERVQLPPLDDAFVARVTKDKITSVEQLRTNVRADVHEYWSSKSERQVLNDLIGEIIRRHEFDVPESLIRGVLDGLLEEMKQEYPQKQLPADFDMNRFTEQNRAYAIAQAKWALLREEIIKAEQLTADDGDLEALATLEAERVKIDRERLINYYKTSEQIKDRIVGDKLIKLLVAAAVITEAPDTQPA